MGPRSTSRREALAGLGATALATIAGCSDALQRFGGSGPSQLSLDITTLPADDDSASAQIARQLHDNLTEVGINVTLDPRENEQALRALLLDHDYDIFVGRHPALTEPDELRTLLHTKYSEERGWQNPYGVTDRMLDDLLERQRNESGDQRRATVNDLQRELLDLQPLSVISYPSAIIAARSGLATDGIANGLQTRDDYLRIEATNPTIDNLSVSLLNPTATENLNPLVPNTASDSAVLDLLYDPLFERIDGELVPWLAEDVTWTESGNTVTATVQLRRALRWHDGEALATADVGFTYDLLRDTTLGDDGDPIPAPRFRGRSSLVERAEILSNSEITFTFEETSIETARRALTVPILPQDEWAPRSERTADNQTTAIQTDNMGPIGSGPFVFEDVTTDQELVLSRNEDHFLLDIEEPDDRVVPLQGESTFDAIEFEVAPNVGVALNEIETGNRDITANTIPTDTVEGIRADRDGTEVLIEDGYEFFVIGFNARRHPMGNHQFRRSVARLINRNHIVETTLDGHAEPSDTPLERTGFVTDEFGWGGESALGPFPGTGEAVDEEAGKQIFRDAGFNYDEDGNLLVQE